MTRARIDRFFAILARELGVAGRVYVTGAAAAALWGRARPSVDIDFGIELRTNSAGWWSKAEAAVTRTSRLTGIPASAAEDIDRWGMITLLDYRRSSRLYRRFGALEVRLLDPTRWAIGKITRYLDSDLRDVTSVFKQKKVAAAAAGHTWGRALRASPRSTSQFQFRQNVERFFVERGPSIWGRRFDSGTAIHRFHRSAGIKAVPGDGSRKAPRP
jgi:hypothetical protein